MLLGKVPDPAERIFYLKAVAAFGWSRNVLLNQIKARAYDRSLAEGKSHNSPLALPDHLAEQAEEALKSSYNLEFLGIRQAVKERELENQLIDKLRDFILELGYGFCFIGRQHRLTLGRNEYFIDLLFYHRFLKSLVAIELKLGKFEPEFAGKMDFYLNFLNEKERAADDAPSIGIILCAEKDNLEVEFALKSKTNPIGGRVSAPGQAATGYEGQAPLPSAIARCHPRRAPVCNKSLIASLQHRELGDMVPLAGTAFGDLLRHDLPPSSHGNLTDHGAQGTASSGPVGTRRKSLTTAGDISTSAPRTRHANTRCTARSTSAGAETVHRPILGGMIHPPTARACGRRGHRVPQR